MPYRPIRTWQIWNEPGVQYQWSPQDELAAEVRRAAASSPTRRSSRPTRARRSCSPAWRTRRGRSSTRSTTRAAVKGSFDVAARALLRARSRSQFLEVTKRLRASLDATATSGSRSGGRRRARRPARARSARPATSTSRRPTAGLASQLDRRPTGCSSANRNKLRIQRVYWYTWASSYSTGAGAFDFSGMNVFDGRNGHAPSRRSPRTARARGRMRAARRTRARAASPLAPQLSLALIAAARAGAAAAAERRVPPRFIGVMWDKEIQDAPARAAARAVGDDGPLGRRVRAGDLLLEPRPGAAEVKPNFVRADQMVRNAARHGIDLLPVIVYAPPWARVVPGELWARRPSDLRAYGRYVSRAGAPLRAARLLLAAQPRSCPGGRSAPGRSGTSRPASTSSRRTAGWPARYAKLLRAAARAIAGRDPRAKVVLAGFANDAWTAIAQLYRRGGVRRYFDAAARAHVLGATGATTSRSSAASAARWTATATGASRSTSPRWGRRRRPACSARPGTSTSR